MPASTRPFNTFMFFKLPSAWLCGVRLKVLTEVEAITVVRHRWINQNPFRSMFWAVQGMAAEFATGALVMHHIRKRGAKVSMLVLNNRASFTKKATGRIKFRCPDGEAVEKALDKALQSGEGQTVWMEAEGRDAEGDVVSLFQFEWTLKSREAR